MSFKKLVCIAWGMMVCSGVLADCKVSFIDNEGVKITSGEKVLFVDAFFYGGGMNPGDVTQADIIFVTHGDGDHFEGSKVIQVANNTGAKVVADNSVISALSGNIPDSQLITVYPAGSESISIDIEGIHVVTYNCHIHPSNCYFITIGECCIYHPGDYGQFGDYPYHFLQNNTVDLAFCACGCGPVDPNGMIEELLNMYPNAEYLVGIHFGNFARCYDVSNASTWDMQQGDSLNLVSSGCETANKLYSGIKLLGNSPNPFTHSTKINLQIPNAEVLQLNIYDGAGRLVRRLSEDARDNGVNTFMWDGKDMYGKETPCGAYFCVVDRVGSIGMIKTR